MGKYNEDMYSRVFGRLLQMKLIQLGSGGASDVAKRYLPCQSVVDRHYGELIEDLSLKKGEAKSPNLLRGLAEPIQQWAVRQRRSTDNLSSARKVQVHKTV